MTEVKKKFRQSHAIVIVAVLTIISGIYSKFGKFESPYFSSFKVEYSQELIRLQQAKGANRLLQKQWDELRVKYQDEIDGSTKLELLSIGIEIATRQDEIDELLERMTNVDLWNNDRSKSLLNDAKVKHSDEGVVKKIFAISSAIPEQMLGDLRHELELGNDASQRLAEQVGQLQQQLSDAKEGMQDQSEKLDSLRFSREEFALRDSLARNRQVHDSIENVKLVRENERLTEGLEKRPEVVITDLQFLPTKAKKSRDGLYNRSHVEKEGFSISFVPEVHNVDGGVHRSLLLLFEYPTGVEEGSSKKPLTKKMNITSGVRAEFQHVPKWPKTGKYTVTILQDDRVLDKASFDVQ